jgi:hypothetical protein
MNPSRFIALGIDGILSCSGQMSMTGLAGLLPLPVLLYNQVKAYERQITPDSSSFCRC